MNRVSRAPRRRRGFNLVELLIALAISAALLSATMVALDASFMAYQATTEVASTHTIGRLAMHRILTLIRTGTEFAPLPVDPRDSIVESDFIDFRMPDNSILSIEWDEDDEALYVVVGGAGGPRHLLLEGVIRQLDGGGDPVSPFTLEYELGFTLFRATIDLAIVPDDNMSVELDGDNQEVIRLVATAMPRESAFD
ncbi:MAG: prepilin-type N-terminal cleavage/methylation domain-containing protein [Phycisphaerales bacterium]|nr:prepilin-type N-terminal cleavage/methylation domain-containing protein [Phycisphaerae bacterium]NNF42894.1 prepilin-type N-terminal cleavage/methylation domain-containing protein [Phycisphaerales bacterium]NNM27429.1 prepilin-type N-terminal cleavage/methylation domain-containing protein [Phycisphaerales bacterium]